MISACCNTPATLYTIPNPLTAQPLTVAQCDTCRRELAMTATGEKWIRSPFFCADGECRQPIYRFATHPSSGMPVPLWPDPNHLVAEYECRGPGGVDLRADPSHAHPITSQHYCGPDCAPDIGADPHHAMEEGGDPHSYTIGRCVRVVRYGSWELRDPETFTDAKGVGYRAWFADGLHLTTDDQARLMAQWDIDRHA